MASKKKADNSRVIEAAESFGKAMYEEKINQMELNFGIPEIVEDPARLRASVRAAIDAEVFGMYDARKKCLAARKAIFPEGKE